MNTYDKIRNDLSDAMKSKDENKKQLLRVVIGELDRISKNPSDDQVVSVIRKMIQNAKEIGNDYELSTLSEYVPEVLGEAQVRTIVYAMISKNGYTSIRDMGKVMKEMKERYGSVIDGKIVSSVVKEALS